MNEERWLDQAQDLFYEGKYTKALKLLDSRFPEPRAMLYHGWSMNPSDDDDVVTGRHGIRYARDFLQRALHDLNAALAAGAEPRLLMTRADVHASLGDYDQAAADVEQLMHTMPADHPARAVLAERRDELAAGPAGGAAKACRFAA